MGSKAPDAFRTISEVSQILDTPPHVLRFWESKFVQLKPVKRAGGRRYYRPSDLELLGGIKRLLHDDGMTIRGVQKMLRERGVKHVAGLAPPVDPEEWGQGAIEAEEWTGPEAARPSAPDTTRPAEQPEAGDMGPEAPEPAPERPHEQPAAPPATGEASAPEPAPGPAEPPGEEHGQAGAEQAAGPAGAPPRPVPPAASPAAQPAPEATEQPPAPPAEDEAEPAEAPVAAQAPADAVSKAVSEAMADAPADAAVEPDSEAASLPEPTGPLVATALRRLHPPLPEDRARALRAALDRIETLHARLRAALDSTPG